MFSKTEREICRQALVTCFRCRRQFPVNIETIDGVLIVQPVGVIYSADGFICSGCSGPDPLELQGADYTRQTPEEIREEIIDLLFAERGGMSINKIDDIIDIGHTSVSYYLKGLMKDGRVRREQAPEGKWDIYFFIE